MELIACFVWIFGNAIFGLLYLAGVILQLPGLAITTFAQWMLELLGSD